jgi:hypothetical protein
MVLSFKLEIHHNSRNYNKYDFIIVSFAKGSRLKSFQQDLYSIEDRIISRQLLEK